MKSNISIASNIYIRSKANVAEDRPFVNAVQGAKALKLLRDDYLYGLSDSMQLGALQNQELVEGTSCAFAGNGEITHGKVWVAGQLEWVGRCEYSACDKFATCPAAWQVERELSDSAVETRGDTEFRFLGEDIVVATDEQLQAKEVGAGRASAVDTVDDVVDNIDNIEADASKLVATEHVEFYNKFQCLTEPTQIIDAPIDSKILVNAGPGTGKTYSVIQRLLYLLKHALVRADKILLLCYSRAAAQVIRSRIATSVQQGELPPEANQLGVFTFDWFASKYLAELEVDFASYSYNERIKLFNKNIRAEYFSADFFQYFIVDELQDLVDARAKMVLKILEVLQCGYLLLGDRCQAIYDFNSELSSVAFYQKLQVLLPEDAQYYELLHNRRQTEELMDFTEQIRQVLLHAEPSAQNRYANAALKGLKVFVTSLEQLSTAEFDPNKRTAILCRHNGDVLRICGLLCKAGVSHRILRGNMAKPKYKRFLADVFWDFLPTKMSQGEFCRRYIARVNKDVQEATRCFANFCRLLEGESDMLDIAALRQALLRENRANELTISEADCLTVSTIHRAKGQEFDIVYLLKYPSQTNDTSAEEARVRYVAMTRAKETLQKITTRSNVLFRKEKNHYYRISYRGKYFQSSYWCSGISVCHDEDVDQFSFANTGMHENVFANQQYISEHVRKFDPVEAVYCEQDRLYHIIHAGKMIGTLSADSANKFWQIVHCTSDRRNIPKKLTELFVYDIYTVVEKSHNEHLSSIHKQSRIWLGLDIVGMGRANYNNYS